MEIKTKSELLAMSSEELEEENDRAWRYFKKIKAIQKFLELED